MTTTYAFNGDADGLCALQQLRLTTPSTGQRESKLITGVKRDIELLGRVTRPSAEQGLDLVVLDISLDKNRESLLALLDAGAYVRYFDHHHTGEIPVHARFEGHFDLSPTACTSLLVDQYLAEKQQQTEQQRLWALVGAFGDNLHGVATELGRAAGLAPETLQTLEKLGVAINYNAYGETLADLHVPPADLAEEMIGYADPLAFAGQSRTYERVAAGYKSDMTEVRRLAPTRQMPGSLLFVLPDHAWARRASGVFANEVATAHPEHSIAILSHKQEGGYLVSLRVPATAKTAADTFCRRFPTGGGRRTAAGINHLPLQDFDAFANAFAREFSPE